MGRRPLPILVNKLTDLVIGLENRRIASARALPEALEGNAGCGNIRPSFREPQGTGYLGSFSSFVGAPTSRGMVGSLENRVLGQLPHPGPLLRTGEGTNQTARSDFSSFGVGRKPPCPIA